MSRALLLQARRGKAPYLVPVVAEPGRVAVFTEPYAKQAFEALGGEQVGWRNALAPRFLFALPRYGVIGGTGGVPPAQMR